MGAEASEKKLDSHNGRIYNQDNIVEKADATPNWLSSTWSRNKNSKQTVLGRHQEDDRADARHASDKRIYKTAKESAFNQRKRHRGKYAACVGSQVSRRFFNTGVNLLQAGNTGTATDRQRADDQTPQ